MHSCNVNCVLHGTPQTVMLAFLSFLIDDYLNTALALFATSFAYYLNLPFSYVYRSLVM